MALAVRRSNHSGGSHTRSAIFHPHSARSHPLSARSHPHSARSHQLSARSIRTQLALIHILLDLIHTRLDLIHIRIDLIHTRLDLINNRLDLNHSGLYVDLNNTRLDLIYTRLEIIRARLDIIHARLYLIYNFFDNFWWLSKTTGIRCGFYLPLCSARRLSFELLSTTDTGVVFLVPDWGIEPAMASGCHIRLQSYTDWRAGTTTRRHSRSIPPSQRLRSGPLVCGTHAIAPIHARRVGSALWLTLFRQAIAVHKVLCLLNIYVHSK
jgi:hypothetical protein